MQFRWLGMTLAVLVMGCLEPFPKAVPPAVTPRDMGRIDTGPTPEMGMLDAGTQDADPGDQAMPDQGPPDQTLPDQMTPQAGRAPMPGDLIINEVDYDQVSGDTAEFIELLNRSAAVLDVRDVVIEFVNGADSVNGEVYRTHQLAVPNLQPGERMLLTEEGSDVVVPPGVRFETHPDDNREFIQNGKDGIRLMFGGAELDSLAYEGQVNGAGEGEPALDDLSIDGTSISRCPEGEDTGANRVDFQQTFATPGVTNDCRSLPEDEDDPGE
jgi:hypothetical protein